MKRILLVVWVAALLYIVMTSAKAAPTYVISADKSEIKQGETVTMTHTVTPAAGDPAAEWTLKIPVMPGLVLVSASGNKGTISNQAVATSPGQPDALSNKTTLYVALAVPNPINGVITCPIGVLQGGGNPAVLTLVWRY